MHDNSEAYCCNNLAKEQQDECYPKTWGDLTSGGRCVHYSLIFAVFSMLMPWAEAKILFFTLKTLSGLALQMLVLILFWGYPLIKIRRGELFNKYFLIIFIMFIMVIPFVIYDYINGSRRYFVINVDASFGVLVFGFSCFLFSVGLVMHQFKIYFSKKNSAASNKKGSALLEIFLYIIVFYMIIRGIYLKSFLHITIMISVPLFYSIYRRRF